MWPSVGFDNIFVAQYLIKFRRKLNTFMQQVISSVANNVMEPAFDSWVLFMISKCQHFYQHLYQPLFTCSKSTIEKPVQSVKSDQSYQ